MAEAKEYPKRLYFSGEKRSVLVCDEAEEAAERAVREPAIRAAYARDGVPYPEPEAPQAEVDPFKGLAAFDHDGDGVPGGSPKGGNRKRAPKADA